MGREALQKTGDIKHLAPEGDWFEAEG
jgi:hypothetical protein